MADGSGSDYQRLVDLVEELEAGSEKNESALLDMSATFSPQHRAVQMKYNDLIAVVEEIETGRRPQISLEKKEAKPSHLVTAGLEQVQHAQRVVQPQKPTPEKAPAGEAMAKQKENVMRELSSISQKLSTLAPTINELRRRRINISDLVLPSLSVADQTSELERIIEGLNEHVFDKEHLEIVAQEVFGLQQALAEQKKKNPQQLQPGSLEQSLIDLRDQRLSDAVALLQQVGV